MAAQLLEHRLQKTLTRVPSTIHFQSNGNVESEVKRYILFYVKNDKNSDAALDALKKNKILSEDTHAQNALRLGQKRPWWLEGVPTIFDKSTSSLLKGNACIHFIQTFKKNNLFRVL